MTELAVLELAVDWVARATGLAGADVTTAMTWLGTLLTASG